MASIANDIRDDDDYLHLPSVEEEDYAHLPSEEEDDEDDEEEEEDSHEYIRPDDFLALALLVDLIGYRLADLLEAQDAATTTADIIPSVGVVAASDDSELAAAVAEALETVEAPSDDGHDCPICLQGDGTAAWKETPCGHRFHGRCVERWLHAKGSCPMCRSRVVTVPAAAAATSIGPEIEWSVILELYGQVIATSALMEE